MVGQTDRDTNVVITVKGLERLKFDAQAQKDSSALNAVLDDSVMLVEQDGMLRNKAEYLVRLRSSDVTVQQITPESITVKVFGGTAIALGIYAEKGIEGHRPYRRRCRFIDTWAFKKGKWVCIASTATSKIN